MTLKTSLKDGTGTNNLARISNVGELTVTGYPGATPVFKTMSVASQVYNFFAPLVGHNLIITAIVMSSTSGPVVNIFEAPSAISSTIDKTLINLDLPAAGVFTIPFPFGGFLSVNEGEFVNATTSGVTVRMTIIGFYRPI